MEARSIAEVSGLKEPRFAGSVGAESGYEGQKAVASKPQRGLKSELCPPGARPRAVLGVIFGCEMGVSSYIGVFPGIALSCRRGLRF